jgi:hypothetical protein
MVRFILLITFFSFTAKADFLGLKSASSLNSKIPLLVQKLKSMEMEKDPSYEDTFNRLVKNIEQGLEEEKLFCAGEVADSSGKVLPKEQKQLCFRELKSHYLEAVDVIFQMKKKYLSLIHTRQLERLGEIQKKTKADIDKTF